MHNLFANVDGLIASSYEQCTEDCRSAETIGTRSPVDVSFGQATTVAEIVRTALEGACGVPPDASPCPYDWSAIRDLGNIVVVHENCICNGSTGGPCKITPTQNDWEANQGRLRTSSCEEVLATGAKAHKLVEITAPIATGK
eukprot:COSAG02_NODE_4303_length_5530_cov_2.345609_2_plen_142_part_00